MRHLNRLAKMRFRKLSKNAWMCLGGTFVFLLFGVFIFPLAIWIRGRVDDMLKWPSIEAEIVAADTTWTRRKGEAKRYQHTLIYRFAVGGQNYTGDRVSYGGTPPEWYSEAEARRALPQIGSRVQIHYNPREPSDSVIHVIRTSDAEEQVLRWLVGGVGTAGALLMVAGGIAWRREVR